MPDLEPNPDSLDLNNIPPKEAINNLLEVIATGSKLVGIREATGSFSNSTHFVEAISPSHEKIRFIVRRYAEFGGSRSEKARLEFNALRLRERHGIAAPKPIYLDEHGKILGSPGIVTTYVSGKQLVTPGNPYGWARSMASTLAEIHDIIPTEDDKKFLLDGNREAIWFLRPDDAPEYMASHPDGTRVWEESRQLYLSSIQQVRPALVHIDYWPGNILWKREKITAVVDWEEAAFGDPAIDVGYLRMELSLWGLHETADYFLNAYESETGARVENLGFWELAASVRHMPNPARWLPEWQTLGLTNLSELEVRKNFRQFVADARKRVGLP